MSRLLKDHPLVHRAVQARFSYLKTGAVDIRLSWPDETELLGMIDVGEDRFFVGGNAVSEQRSEPDDYRILTADEATAIEHYRTLRLFLPWPQPVLGGTETERRTVTMKDIGSAQVWWGGETAVIWEVLLSEATDFGGNSFNLAYRAFWEQVESYLRTQGVTVFATEEADPAYDTRWYQETLRTMGYTPYAEGGFRKELARADAA